jgi:alpha-L-rhamnosidase
LTPVTAVTDWMHQYIGGIRIKEAGYRRSPCPPAPPPGW